MTAHLIPGHVHPRLAWLAPDGREWGARRNAHRAMRSGHMDGLFYLARSTPVWRACRLSIDLLSVGPLGSPALWALHRPEAAAIRARNNPTAGVVPASES